MKRKLLLALSLLLTLSVFRAQYSQSSLNGAPAGYCAAPSDAGRKCTSCHSGSAVTKTGWITSDIPATGYVPGVRYHITATAIDSGRSRFGFQVSPQNAAGVKLGTLIVTNATTTKLVGSSKYIDHTTAGSTGTLHAHSWSFDWVAPVAGSGPVNFYGAFNGADNDGGESGDHIFLSQTQVSEGCAVTAAITTTGTFSCPQDSLILTATGGTKYVWNTGDTSASIQAKAGTYSVIVSSGLCADTATITLAATCAAPDSVYMSSVFGTTATINWKTVPCASGYLVKWRKVGATAWTSSVVLASAIKKVIPNLLPLTNYQAQVFAKCGTKYSVASPIQSFTTLCACDQLSAVVLSGVTSTKAVFSWTGNACAYKYKLQYRKLGAATWTTVTALAPLLTKTISNLVANTTYEYHLRTECNATATFYSPWTTTATFTTPLVRIGEELSEPIIFPNPSDGLFQFSTVADFVVTDLNGRLLLSERNAQQVDLSQFPNGVYLIELKNEAGVFRQKIQLNK